jgi:hypothetical protein
MAAGGQLGDLNLIRIGINPTKLDSTDHNLKM